VPAFLIVGVLQPILYLALFGPLLTRLPAGTLSGGSGAGGTAEAYRFFVPGLLIQLALFGSAFVGFAIISEWRAGVIERYRVTPVSRVALLTGRVLRDVVTLIVQSTVLILAGVDRYIIDAMREAYAGQYWSTITVEGLCVAVGTAAVFLWLGSDPSTTRGDPLVPRPPRLRPRPLRP
jgi:ABC-2 type transport system permease protein